MTHDDPNRGEVIPDVEIAENEPAIEATPEPVVDSQHVAPSDGAAFWHEIDSELAGVPSNPEETEYPLASTDFSTTYSVKLTSIGPYRISAFVSIPHGEGPFPGLFLAPGYASVVSVPAYEDRMRYVVMSLRYRGTRGADWPYAGEFPGMLTDGLDDPRTWIMRGVVADALRGFEYLVSRPEVDQSRVGIMGGDPGLFVSARRHGVAAQSLNASFFYRMGEAHQATEAYPLEEINDFVRTFPEKADAVRRTLSYFDPLYLVHRVTAKLLLASDNFGWYQPLIDAFGGPVERYTATHEGQTDRDAIETWLADRLGAEHLPRTWTPEARGSWSS